MDPEDEKREATRLFNMVWKLLKRDDRSLHDNETMVHAAHASRYHWGNVGEPVHWGRGEWQVSRVYAELGRHESAHHHALRYLEICLAHELEPYDHVYAHEALARAAKVKGDNHSLQNHIRNIHQWRVKITDNEELKFIEEDLATLF